ncbi:MAG: hypothetical protein E6Q68_04975 [Polynucleobacter sp.]|nr:MAG: hypothetical protein E6Q68_04975 [Polynucleobacter sp.]
MKKSSLFEQANGYVLPMVLSLIALTSLATTIALQAASTHLQFLNSEQQYLKMIHASEIKFLEIENQLAHGISIPSDPLIQIEPFQPKYFRSSKGIQTRHYKIQVSTPHPHTNHSIQLRSTLRIDEAHQDKKKDKPPQRSMQRLQWEVLHD